jgi:hypothetical protein
MESETHYDFTGLDIPAATLVSEQIRARIKINANITPADKHAAAYRTALDDLNDDLREHIYQLTLKENQERIKHD